MTNIKKIRFLLGIIIAPLTPGLIFAIHDLYNVGSIGAAWYLTLSAFIGYPTTLFIGLPLYSVFFRNRVPTLSNILLIGLALGALAYSLLFFIGIFKGGFESIQNSLNSTIRFIFVSSVCGLLTAACFWIVVRPDKN